jgi:hypothetical protein
MLLAIGVVFSTLALPPGLVAAEGTCILVVEPPEGRLGTHFIVRGSGFGQPTIVTIRFSEEEVGLTPAITVSEREVDVDEAGRFTLELHPANPDEMGFWAVSAVVPETECGADAVFHVFGPPDTATGPTSEADGPSPLGLLSVLTGAAFVAAVISRPWRQRGSPRVASRDPETR